jgi:hypothetical protein
MRYECATCLAHAFSPGSCTVCCAGERRPLEDEPAGDRDQRAFRFVRAQEPAARPALVDPDPTAH